MIKTILLAEDFEDDAVIVRNTLKQAEVKNPVVTVNDGDKVIAYLKGEGDFSDRNKFPLPSVLLLDIKMPRVSGFQVLEWLSSQPQFAKILIIVLSGYDGIEDVRQAYGLGARSFLIKPCHVEDIKNLVRAYPDYWDGVSFENSPVANC